MSLVSQVSDEPQRVNGWAVVRSGMWWMLGGIFVMAVGLAAAYQLAFTVILFDGQSPTDYDAGNRSGIGLLFLISLPLFVVGSALVAFLLRMRWRRAWVAIVAAPVLVWAVVLVVRVVTGDCSAATSRC